jgi:Asp-tRNA(Asn)/Glu-tRNA(Gln) amidotransferase A subunit family amidase
VRLCADRALAEADAVAPGDARPLCGVPIGIKDLLSATEGLATSHGTSAFGDWVADHDSARTSVGSAKPARSSSGRPRRRSWGSGR